MSNAMLITGCGGDIAQSLARIARESGLASKIVGCDIHGDHPAEIFFDTCEIVPPASDEVYIKRLKTIVAEHGIDVLVPMSEAEIMRLSRGARNELSSQATLIIADPTTIDICSDKYETAKFLSNNGVGTPWTRLVADSYPKNLPCIIKPRHGQGSKGVRIVSAMEEVEFLKRTRAEDIWQELLLPDHEEYTCGVFRDKSGNTRTIILRRRLMGGLTGSAEVADNSAVTALLHNVADCLSLRGSINVQLRVTSDGPKVFEINPRFSSTVGFRHRLGFQDFVWSLLDQQGIAIDDYIQPAAGTRMYKVAREIIFT